MQTIISMRFLLQTLLLLPAVNLYSQYRCSADEMFKNRFKKDTTYAMGFRSDRHIDGDIFSLGGSTSPPSSNSVTLTIPIVVHIMTVGGNLGDPDNPNNEQIKAAVDYANLIFKGSAPMMIPGGTGDAVGDLYIEFKFAVRTPLGASTNGIERINAGCLTGYTANGIEGGKKVGSDELELKSLASWDVGSYLNIYVVHKIDGNDGNQTGLIQDGYAYPPPPLGKPSKLDGVVIIASRMKSNLATLAHEFGHYLGLEHTFKGTENVDCRQLTDCTQTGDFICDTDPVTESEQPRSGTNPCNGQLYSVNTEANVMSYSTRRELFTNGQAARISRTMTNPLRDILFRSSNMALVPPEANRFFNKCTDPNFITNEFNCIGVGKDGHVWAGTNKQGLYKFDGTTWTMEPLLTNFFINDIKADAVGGIWVAQSGSGSTLTKAGGIEYFPHSTFTPTTHFGYLNGLPGPNVRSLFIDKTTMNGTYPLVWSANQWYTYYAVNYDGGITKGVNALPPANNAFVDVSGSGIPKDGNGTAQYIGGNATEVWVIATNNYGNATQLVRYRVQDNTVLNIYGYPGVDELQNFSGRALYIDPNGNKWVGKLDDGIIIRAANDSWMTVNFSNLFLPGTAINSNAITGDENGNVFIGTTDGLIIYRGGPLNKSCGYTRYTTDNGLLSNNVRGICWDKNRQKLLLATDNGIAFWSPAEAVSGTNTSPYVTTSSGALSDPSTWCGGTVPPPNSNLVVRHAVTISTVIAVRSLKQEPGSNITVLSGGHLIITH